MKHKVLLSILIPTYKQAQVVTRAIDSCLAQTYDNFEIIVGDDCSPDHTAEVMRAYSTNSKVKYVRYEKNVGRVKNYNRLVYELAIGEYALFLDGDDYLTNPKYLEHAMELIAKNPDLKLVFGRQNYRDEKTGEQWAQEPLNLPTILDGNDYLAQVTNIADGIPHLSAVFHRQHAIDRGIQQVDCIASDTESLFRIMAGVKIGYLNEVAGVWNLSESNESGASSVDKRFKQLEMITKPAELFTEKKLVPDKIIEQFRLGMLRRYFISNIYIFIDQKAYKNACQYFLLVRQAYGLSVVMPLFVSFKFYVRLFAPKLFIWLKEIKKSNLRKRVVK